MTARERDQKLQQELNRRCHANGREVLTIAVGEDNFSFGFAVAGENHLLFLATWPGQPVYEMGLN